MTTKCNDYKHILVRFIEKTKRALLIKVTAKYQRKTDLYVSKM